MCVCALQRWRKVWCVLVAESRRSVSRLELYERKHSSIKQGSSKRKPDYKQVIRLRECIQISEREIAACPKDCAAFYLETSDKVYVFAAQRSEVKDWIKSLCEQAFPDIEGEQRLQRESCLYSDPVSSSHTREMKENSLYDTAESVRDFLVIAVGTEAAVRCSLYGEYILTPLPDCLLLKDVKTKKVLFKWMYCYVRKFGQDMLSFSFEAGRRCESGEGNFEFATHQGERLFNIVSAAIQNLPRPSTAKPISPDHVEQSLAQETMATDETYDYTIDSQASDVLPEGKMQKASKMLNPSWRSFSLNAIEPESESQVSSIDADLENQEPIYATVSKAQQKATSPTDPQMHWQNLRKALQQSASFRDSFKTDADISQLSDFTIPREEGAHEETEAAEGSTDLLGDSIQQLAINDALQDISAEAIYADPQDLQARAEWVVGGVYDEPEEVIKANERAHDGAEHLAEHDFFYSPDMGASQAMAALSNPVQSSDELFSTYDNFRLKGRRM
ncbi:docking protein 3-like [Sinocyclocheilus anshuiensis]|uniref:docking protein 3-like n=1 Tax=Sinocyclocheilus anshuiensis TaxID=1608454 RepID=UPI0007B844B0|nr:PREDICTED: docking protein 3-like [Sinocyclocheilus anshuiensis]